MEGKSLYVFNVDNSLRRTIYNIVNHPYFDNCILALIILSTIFAAIENPLLDQQEQTTQILKDHRHHYRCNFHFRNDYENTGFWIILQRKRLLPERYLEHFRLYHCADLTF